MLHGSHKRKDRGHCLAEDTRSKGFPKFVDLLASALF